MNMKPPGGKPKVTTFRLDPDVCQMLDTFCQTTRRSKNNAVNYLLADALRAALKIGSEQ
ncbi:MAG TPA: hypothetical protein VKZ65_08995 [Glycomyces sp.]|nr:hypothetical protein [Glycomyces sp.]